MILCCENKFALLQPQGCLDAVGSMKLQEQIGAIAPDTYNLWILDLAQVDFIDSSGLVALIAALNRANQHRCRLVVCNLHPAVKLIFEITRLDQAFEIVDSPTTVLDSMATVGTEPILVQPQWVAA
ncbi:STAS domain-containing protein [Pantanalinema rosaneae CENA516]|uniref:STAS domain-containing protein n=1 Tax=Pantanalinema rosaneae TaxID=1620701 RepID=UPI003D6F4A7B